MGKPPLRWAARLRVRGAVFLAEFPLRWAARLRGRMWDSVSVSVCLIYLSLSLSLSPAVSIEVQALASLSMWVGIHSAFPKASTWDARSALAWRAGGREPMRTRLWQRIAARQRGVCASLCCWPRRAPGRGINDCPRGLRRAHCRQRERHGAPLQPRQCCSRQVGQGRWRWFIQGPH